MEKDAAEIIMDTTPEKVYRVLRGYDRDLYVDTGNGHNCPLHHFFCDALLMEPDNVLVDMEQVRLGYRGEGEFWLPLPQWMTDYQEFLMSSPFPSTIGGCLDLLANMFHEECLTVDEGEEDGTDEIASVEECIAQLEATHGTDRDPVASAVYYLKMYAASLANGKERNG